MFLALTCWTISDFDLKKFGFIKNFCELEENEESLKEFSHSESGFNEY